MTTHKVIHFLCLIILAACTGKTTPETDTPQAKTPTETVRPSVTMTSSAVSKNEYISLNAPLIQRSDTPQAGLENVTEAGFSLFTGEYQLVFGDENGVGGLLLTRVGASTGLVLKPLGAALNLLQYTQQVSSFDEGSRTGVVLTGMAPWADFSLHLWLYPYNPGLIHYQLELIPHDDPPSGQVSPEWTFVDAQTGEEAAAGYQDYAAKAAAAAPSFYGYTEAMDSTLLHWVDLTRLNPFIEATRYSSDNTPVHRGRSFGHNLSSINLRRLPPDQPWLVYDSYLYLAAGKPASEAELFLRYLQQVGDIYDLLARPSGALPDWQAMAAETLKALDDPDTWVALNGKRYWRAYVADTRQSAEAITQLDVGLAVARYVAKYGADDLTAPILADALVAIQDFYNSGFGLIQNSGPLALSGDQGRGDTWYELGHALKAAEWGLLGYDQAATLAQDSQAAWMDFAQTVDYQFPQFYSFATWQGTGREPDASGGYALYMLQLADLGCGNTCLEEAQAAVRAFPGSGFAFTYETHMTAASALAAAELAARTGDDTWLEYAYGPLANLIRLSWIYEVDYGLPAPARTFFGLAPTQRAAAITPKEQYESWIYLTDFLRLAHGRIDPTVEKLVAEFRYHTLVTMADSLPPHLPDGVVTEHPAAYETVATNRLDLYIPIEDMRDGWDVWGSIGQEVYGAGMALTFAALAYEEIAPGVTVYSGYPVIQTGISEDRLMVTWAGADSYQTPVVAWGVARVILNGAEVATEICGEALCFEVEAGLTYLLMQSP